MSKASNYDEIYTIEDLEAYSKRLHFNTVFVLIINTFTSYIVIKYSTAAMGNYKYYILFTIISATFMDFHATFIFGIFPLFPLPGFCGAGVIAKNFNYFWGEIFPFLILQEAFSFCGNSILISLLYRYAVMKQNVEFFHSWYGIIIMLIFITFYPTAPAVVLMLSLDSRNVTVQYVKDHAPHMFELFKDGPCNSMTYEKSIPFALTLFIHIAVVWLFGVFIVFKTLKLIGSVKSSLSKSTYRMYRQFTFSLAVQLTIPFIFMFVPASFSVFAIILNVQNVKDYAINAMQGLFLHSAINSLSILFVIKTYRDGAKILLLKLICCYKTTVPNAKVQPSSTVASPRNNG